MLYNMPQKKIAPATFRYVAFYDLLADSAFQHKLATESTDTYVSSRHARASIIASALSIECMANCLLESVDAPKALLEEIDKLAPLPKIETALRMKGITSFERGRHQVQKAADLIRARNDYIHAKTTTVDAEIHEPRDAGKDWMIPFVMQGDVWRSLGIPKQAMFWSKDASLAVLRVVCEFIRYLLIEVMKAEESVLQMMLPSRLEFGNALMPAVFDEFQMEISALSKEGIDFSFLKLTSI